jgi:2Fe-2S ferredoxin
MPKITYIAFDGAARPVDAKPGTSLMETAVRNNVDGIVAECGGSMSCGTCHIWVEDAWRDRTGHPSRTEAEIIELSDNFRDGSRLACQIKVTDALDGLVVRTPESQP